MLGWVDHPEYYGPLNVDMLDKPEVVLSAVVIEQSDEGFEKAIGAWSRFGTLSVVEAVYAYVSQVRRRVIGEGELRMKLLEILPAATELDILAMQRVLKLGLGITTCDLGLVLLSYVPVGDAGHPQRPLGTIYELMRGEATIYVARNAGKRGIYDGETMCVVPISSQPPLHPLYEAYLRGFRIVTEGVPTEDTPCVVHKKLGLRCLDARLVLSNPR
ncbi:hypothetical protein [Pyrobaculum ferrireducens]|uniref:Uncharacterized protein n=1 Tax=Pyrobaculum ferrireducens TaxID=1104324 RepID=G7VHE3_9CREN|nr:hypothetical protein [Pyrobaculum ferrireducens]AET32046.1 hypothetical protein P186_0594 [Pyrobaculum ferrireducens]